MIRHFLLTIVSCALALSSASAADFYAVAEQDGTVALCLAKGSLLFADRCEGSGRLSIIQPIREGNVVWRSVAGTVAPENEAQNPECALSRAKWEPKDEQVVSTGRKIKKVDRAEVLKRLKEDLLKDEQAVAEDIEAFALDLDGNGEEETVFAASNLNRLGKRALYDKPVPYFAYAGVLPKNSPIPSLLYSDRGDYSGGTDAIGDAVFKGVVPIAPGTGELALLFKAGSSLQGVQTLSRYHLGMVQRIEVIEFNCN